MFTIVYCHSDRGVKWVEFGDMAPYSSYNARSANRYCSFDDFHCRQQSHGWASSPHGLGYQGTRNYFLRLMRKEAKRQGKTDHARYSVRRVNSEAALEQLMAELEP